MLGCPIDGGGLAGRGARATQPTIYNPMWFNNTRRLILNWAAGFLFFTECQWLLCDNHASH
ncbi:hypothetical protein [Thiospirillum jenense]|uniref:Uncharacterized protein n=1 Tax=Thiospirillum jenense TaxID=1653858 RepID=A0A839H9J5_9GAMM|nr:hypothetical protein [Thiospirillum jenense]MBB1125953.1 hypothetical protein [Thiospirillum jenense]